MQQFIIDYYLLVIFLPTKKMTPAQYVHGSISIEIPRQRRKKYRHLYGPGKFYSTSVSRDEIHPRRGNSNKFERFIRFIQTKLWQA